MVKPITYSIDAALALVERANTSGAAPDVMLSDALERLGRDGLDPDSPLGPQIARALLIEFLSAKIKEARHAG